jgi:prophage maintenance system killer protein
MLRVAISHLLKFLTLKGYNHNSEGETQCQDLSALAKGLWDKSVDLT